MPKHTLTRVCIQPMVSVEKSQLTDNGNTTYRMTKVGYNKLHPRPTRPFQTIKVQPRTVAIDKDGVPNTIPIFKATVAPMVREQLP